MEYLMKGAMFQQAPINDGRRRPMMTAAVEIMGVKINMAVWPPETSAKGTKYWPVTGQYHRDEQQRLVSVNPIAQVVPSTVPSQSADKGGQVQSVDNPF